MAPDRLIVWAVVVLARRQRRAHRGRAEDPRLGDRPDLRRGLRAPDPGRRDPGAGRRGAARAGRDPGRRPARGDGERRAGAGHRLRGPGPDPALRAGHLRRRRRCCSGSRAACSRRPCSRTMFALRRDVEAKLNRLPLPYFDAQPRGELLSRVTNDIDNVAQTLQQTLSQLLTSLLTVVGGGRDDVLDLVAARAHRARDHPASTMVVTAMIAQAQPEALRAAVEQHRRAQRHRRGDLHRARARQGLRPPGRGRPRLRRARTTSCSRRASARSSSAASSCRR